MTNRWFYSHEGQTHGPFLSEELQALAAQGQLRQDDLIWQEGGSEQDALPARAALQTLPDPPPHAVPDWIAEVALLRSPGPLRPAGAEATVWLEDMRLWFGLELVESTTANVPGSPPVKTQPLPDWLEDWLPGSEPTPSPGPGTEHLPPPIMPPVDDPVPAIPAATPVGDIPPPPLALPVNPAAPAAIALSAPEAPSSQSFAEEQLVRKSILATGFDPRTGQILDAEKFNRWKQQPSSTPGTSASVTNASMFEVFRKARTAIEHWVDDDRNHSLIMTAGIEEIGNHPEIQFLLRQYEGYGKEMQGKLDRHLRFMVENRRKYRLATGG